MTFNFLSVFLVLTLILLKCKARVCSKTYILTLFEQDSLCSTKYSTNSCAYITAIFMDACSDVSQKRFGLESRQLISVFNFNREFVYTCLHNKFYANCMVGYNFSQYPDTNELFGWGLNQTLQRLSGLKLRTFYVLLFPTEESIENQTDSELKNLTTFTDTNYLEFRNITYDKFENMTLTEMLCLTEIQEKTGKYSPPTFPTLELTIGIPSGIILLLILVWIAFWTQRVWKRWQESKIEAFAFEHAKSARQILFGRYLDEFEVTPKELRVDQDKVLGQGAFGTVYLGHLKKTRNNELIEMDVAVKFPHLGASETIRQDMINEIGFMKALGRHDNLLTMVGYVKSIENPVVCTVYCSNGSLLSVLQKHKLHFMSQNKCEEVEICLILNDLLRISLEVCNGLIYLVSKGYIHRDIAARNVLLTDTLSAKLSDFGLCKQLMDSQDFLIDKGGKFPIKYMPYESITMGQFSEKSGVWSFGILIWEMLSGGKKPFDTLEFDNFIDFLEQSGKPEFSRDVPQNLTQILNNYCFQKEPELRLNFVELKEELQAFYLIVLGVMNQPH